MNIKIKKTDLLNYVLGKTNADPIEKAVGAEKIEVFNCGIWNLDKKKMIKQSPVYENFCQKVVGLRQTAHKKPYEEILAGCDELMLVAPVEVELETNYSPSK